jgi:hypothetical protein
MRKVFIFLPTVILGLVAPKGVVAGGRTRVDHTTVCIPANLFGSFEEMKIIGPRIINGRFGSIDSCRQLLYGPRQFTNRFFQPPDFPVHRLNLPPVSNQPLTAYFYCLCYGARAVLAGASSLNQRECEIQYENINDARFF